MKRVIPLLGLLVFFGSTLPAMAQAGLRFEDYRVKVYRGRIHRPDWIRRVSSDEWRDEVDKSVGAPEINFAGKYFVAIHGCGTYCRYYTLTDLSTGRDLDVLRGFYSGELEYSKRDGELVIELLTRPNSRLLVAQYHVYPQGDECREERAFVLVGKKLKPVTKRRRGCTKY